jgi:hypothetical protein
MSRILITRYYLLNIKCKFLYFQVTGEFPSPPGETYPKKAKVCPVSTDNINENKFDRHRILS